MTGLMKPFIHVNCAMSADGKLAGPDRKQVRISSEEDKARVKEMRRKYDAILVGVGTVISDDPHLTVKGLSPDENPVRIVLDSNGRIPENARVFDDLAHTVVITSKSCTRNWGLRATVVRCGENGKIDLPVAMHLLARELGIENVMVEGGGEVISSFFREKLVDRYTVFVGGLVIGGRTSPTPADGDGWVAPDGIKLRLISAEALGNGALLTFAPEY